MRPYRFVLCLLLAWSGWSWAQGEPTILDQGVLPGYWLDSASGGPQKLEDLRNFDLRGHEGRTQFSWHNELWSNIQSRRERRDPNCKKQRRFVIAYVTTFAGRQQALAYAAYTARRQGFAEAGGTGPKLGERCWVSDLRTERYDGRPPLLNFAVFFVKGNKVAQVEVGGDGGDNGVTRAQAASIQKAVEYRL